MCYRNIFVCLFGLLFVAYVKMGPVEINIKIGVTKNQMTCNYGYEQLVNNTYTLFEGESCTLSLKHKKNINYIRCQDKYDRKNTLNPVKNPTIMNNFNVTKAVGTTWNCSILAYKYINVFKPHINLNDSMYAVTFCYFQLHVRPNVPPQVITVNYMILHPTRTDLTVKDYDFDIKYYYADGDIINVMCINANEGHDQRLYMEYSYADSLTDLFNTSQLSSYKAVGFISKFYLSHHNSYMICNMKGHNDYMKVRVHFMMKTEFNIISVTFNELPGRPTSNEKDFFIIDYRQINNEIINLGCKVNRTDVELVGDASFQWIEKGRYAVKTISDSTETETNCSAKYKTGNNAEIIEFKFTKTYVLSDNCPLYMNFDKKKTIIQLFEYPKLEVIYYEYTNGENVAIKCFTSECEDGPVTRIVLKYSDTETEETSITVKLSQEFVKNTPNITCSLQEMNIQEERKMKEIVVIFIEKTVTTISSTSSTSTTTTVAPTTLETAEKSIADWILVVAAAVTVIVIICVVTAIYKMRKRNQCAQVVSHDPNYVNQVSIPRTQVFKNEPRETEINYAVPVDQREDNATYTVPYKPEDVIYTKPIPKSQRRNNNTNHEPTYALLDRTYFNKGHRNTFRETDDPNYSEICCKTEQPYAKVIPKSLRKNQNENPYASVTYDRHYANTGNVVPEPTYYEPNCNKNQYSNILDANNLGQECIEPTYCELGNQHK